MPPARNKAAPCDFHGRKTCRPQSGRVYRRGQRRVAEAVSGPKSGEVRKSARILPLVAEAGGILKRTGQEAATESFCKHSGRFPYSGRFANPPLTPTGFSGGFTCRCPFSGERSTVSGDSPQPRTIPRFDSLFGPEEIENTMIIGRSARSSVVREREVVEADFVGLRSDQTAEQLGDQTAEMITTDGVEVVLSVAAGFNETGDAKESEVVADGRLALTEAVAEGADVEFSFAEEVHQDAETGFIREELEDLDEFFLQLGGEFGNGGAVLGFFRGFEQLR